MTAQVDLCVSWSETPKTGFLRTRLILKRLWAYVVEETGEPEENYRPWTGDHYPATRLHPRSNPGGSGDKRVFNHYAMTITVSYFKETIQNGPTFNVLCAVWPSTDWKDFSDIFKTK